MSTFVPSTIACRCSHRFTAQVARSLHVSLRNDLRVAVLAGELNRFRCPACGQMNRVESLLAYTDFKRRQWFTVVPAAGVARPREWLTLAERSFHAVFIARAAPVVRTWAPTFRRRVIFGMASLREKLVTFEAGLDDRVVEQLKLDLIADGRLGYAPGGYAHLVEVTGDDLVLEWAAPGEPGSHELVVARSEYDACAGDGERPRARELVITPVVDMRTLWIPDESVVAATAAEASP